MTDKTEVPTAAPESGAVHVSRRHLLRGVAVAAGGVAILVGAVMPAEAKMPQKASGYQDKPKGQAMCSNCAHFEPPHSCGIVAGNISPTGCAIST
jgi:hypothetical protein